MTSLFSAKSPKSRESTSGTFRRRWRGYDTGQVDEFLRQTAADRQRLEEGLAQLEALGTTPASQSAERRREFERLTKLRADVASCLEASIGALRTATELLANGQVASVEPQRQPMHAGTRSRTRWMPGRRSLGLTSLAAAVLLLPFVGGALFYQTPATTAAKIPVALPPTPPPAVPAEPAAVNTPAPAEGPRGDGLVLTLTARRQCWIRTRIDGGQPLERVLKADETIMLRATADVSVRVGDAGALSMLINNRVAKPFGASGQVVDARITLSNYLTLLVDHSAP